MEITPYFKRNVLENPERDDINREMCEAVVASPEALEVQPDGRTRYWGRPEGSDTYLRVIVTADGTALHNAFFDSNFTHKQRRDQ